MERTRIAHPNGTVTLLGRGPRGAVTLDAWKHGDQVHGVISIHLPDGPEDAPRSGCEYLPGGTCYPDQTFVHALEPAAAVVEGNEDAGWAAVEEWYASRVGL